MKTMGFFRKAQTILLFDGIDETEESGFFYYFHAVFGKKKLYHIIG